MAVLKPSLDKITISELGAADQAKAPKRRHFIAGLIKGKSMRRSALSAGYTQSMADNAGRKILPGARAEFQRELAKIKILPEEFQEEAALDKIIISELVEDLLTWYATINRKPTFRRDVVSRWTRHLRPSFGEVKASELGTAQLRSYRAQRTAAGAADATVNRELQILRKAYKLAAKAEPPRVRRIPNFEFAKEDNARKVFIDPETAQRLKEAAGAEALWERAFLEMALTLGWRKSELEGLRVGNVRLAENVIRIEDSKNGEPREVPLTPALRILLEPLVLQKPAEQSLWPVKDFRYAWKRICKAAGVNPGLDGIILHDARRTSARTKRAAGVSESVIMDLHGWKTAGMFRRYAICNQADRRRALLDEESFLKEAERQREQARQIELFKATVATAMGEDPEVRPELIKAAQRSLLAKTDQLTPNLRKARARKAAQVRWAKEKAA